ncbi:hypothetical protein D3C87_2176530 [compost metagenome]
MPDFVWADRQTKGLISASFLAVQYSFSAVGILKLNQDQRGKGVKLTACVIETAEMKLMQLIA